MNITGISDSSLLSSLYSSGKVGSNSPLSGNGATISEIRDQVDKLATSGQLTSLQQVVLIAGGFQDMNVNDLTYQPVGESRYSRSSSETINVVGTLEGYAAFDTSHANPTGAAMFDSLAAVFKHGKDVNGFDTTG